MRAMIGCFVSGEGGWSCWIFVADEPLTRALSDGHGNDQRLSRSEGMCWRSCSSPEGRGGLRDSRSSGILWQLCLEVLRCGMELLASDKEEGNLHHASKHLRANVCQLISRERVVSRGNGSVARRSCGEACAAHEDMERAAKRHKSRCEPMEGGIQAARASRRAGFGSTSHLISEGVCCSRCTGRSGRGLANLDAL